MRLKNKKGHIKKFFRTCKIGLASFFANFNFVSRTKGGKVFKITFFFFLYAAAVVGIVFGLINLGKNNEKNGLFGNTYNTSYKLNLSTTNEATAESLTKEATEKFTNYLVYKNINANNISYSVKKNSSNGYDGYIYVSYTNVAPYYDDNFKNSDTDGYYSIDPNKFAIDSQSSSTLSVWYFNPKPSDTTKVENYFTYTNSSGGKSSQVLSSSNFDYLSARSDKRGNGENADDLNNYGVSLKLKGDLYKKNLQSAGLETIKEDSNSSNGSTVDTSSDLQWVVFKNIDQLVNKLNYAKWVVYNYKYMSLSPSKYSGGVQTKWNVYYDNLKSTDSNLVTWAEKAVGTITSGSNNINTITPQYLIVAYEKALGRSFTATNLTNLSNDGDSSLLDVVKDYVVGSVTKVNFKQWFPQITESKKTISANDVTSFSIQPYAYESSNYNSTSSSDSSTSTSSATTTQSAVVSTTTTTKDSTTSASTSSASTTATTAQKTATRSSLIYNFKNNSLPVEFYTARPTKVDATTSWGYSSYPYIVVDQELSSSTLSETNNTIVNTNRNTSNYFGSTSWVSNPYVETNIISKISSYNSMFLASGVILLIIAIIVSVLYRIPGVFGAFAVIASFAFSLSLLVVFKIDISLPSILALFIGLIATVVSISLTMERMRKLIQQRNSVFDSIQTGIKKSMLTVVDIHVALMVLGLSIFFISKGETNNFGITLLLSSLLSIGSLFAFFLIPLFAYSSFRFSWNIKMNMLHFVKQTNSKVRLRFSPKKWWIIWGVLIFVALFGLILFFILGLKNSIYNGGTFLYITALGNTDTSKINVNDFFTAVKSALGGSWTLSIRNVSDYPSAVVNSIPSSGYYYVVIQGYNSSSYSLTAIQEQLTAIINKYYNSNTTTGLATAIINNINVNNVSSALLSSLFLRAICALLAGYGFMSIYYAVRLNALTVIPVFAVSCVTTMFSIALMYIVQVQIDIMFIYAVLSTGVVSNVFSCLYISVAKTRFVRRKIFEARKIQFFVLNNMRSLLNVVYLGLISNVIIFGLLAGLVSPVTISLFLTVMAVNIISIPLGFLLTAHLYYYVILIRQKYVLSIINSFDNKISSELIERDEQLIMGINKFH